MRSSTLPWRLHYILALAFGLFSVSVLSAPAVNVALQASFDAGPYLLELLETAAYENSSSYFPLLDRIAQGIFADLTTEKALFDKFVEVLNEDGHIRDPESLSSFKLALALHAAAPRIEVHYQYYATAVEPKMMAGQDAACPVWVHFDEKQYCSPALERAQQDLDIEDTISNLPFDRALASNANGMPSILYADITHPLFGQFHEAVSKTAKEGRTSYRLRYRPPMSETRRPLYLNGYGVELVLKRTDYIVIDDRETANVTSEASQTESAPTMPGDEPEGLKPLTTSELSTIGLNAASYIMSSPDPLDALLKVSGNFPTYSPVIASQNATEEFLTEYKGNRAIFLPQGYNVLWVNGAQVESRQINAFSLLDLLKRERSLINQLRDLGLTASEGIQLLSHSAITQPQIDDEPQRYDWRDESEGGAVIIWLNDLEKDKRYAGWPNYLNSLLQRTYVGQLPTVARDIHNFILPVDLTNPKDLKMVVDTLQSFIKRTVPVRFGLVPKVGTEESARQAKLVYHIQETYGLAALFEYLEAVLNSNEGATGAKSSFASAIKERKPRQDQEALSYDAVVDSADLKSRIEAARAYSDRLALFGKISLFLVNGVVIARNDNWLEMMSTRVTMDFRSLQRGVLEELFPEDMWLPEFFLYDAMAQRNPLIIPEDPKDIKIVDVSALAKTGVDRLPKVPAASETDLVDIAQLLVVADLDHDLGKALLEEAIKAHEANTGLEILVLHNPSSSVTRADLSAKIWSTSVAGAASLSPESVGASLSSEETVSEAVKDDATAYWNGQAALVNALGISPGSHAFWLNGRLIPLDEGESFNAADLVGLASFERSKRIAPVANAIAALNLDQKIVTPMDLAKITSLVARSHISDVPEGIYESAPLIRMDKFIQWNGTYTSIHKSALADPSIQIVAAVDPASEVIQHWIPILKVLSELDGVDLKIHLNPKEKVFELPVKRFYRQVLTSSPVFGEDGSLEIPKATFTKVPGDALLNLGMDVPPSWLVAAKECTYDLDNIKLESVPAGQDVDALYELEHILIEGHSRDITSGSPPRGAQLLLGTDADPHFADTLIMANLGYFQFKANPGYWQIALQPGRSSKIFHIDSAGLTGYSPQPNDNTTSVALLSFQGTTLFPRLSRNPGMESEDVLEPPSKLSSAMDYLSSAASSALSSVGLAKPSPSSLHAPHAEINIFSVASGHLYERMLNIMILSVLRHTTHSVKFWFIEQFLSPQFKSTLPHLAAHYNFRYSLITYKWPHWLRSQKEKQREIWGYKILFLDVLFPLSLDKVIFVDADQIVRTDLIDLVRTDLHGAPYGFTPMCDSRTEMEGFRFWKQGYWLNYLQGKPYHISALYVVDLRRFRELAAGDRLRQQYHALSADPASLSNLDQDLPNHMQHALPIYSLPQDWLWCETWCSDASLQTAKTIDLCNNPLTKEPKLDRARRQVPEWRGYDEEIADVVRGAREAAKVGDPVAPVGEEARAADPGQEPVRLPQGRGFRKVDEL